MEDVMETCWIDSVTMCPCGYKCESCPKEQKYKEENRDKEKLSCTL